MKIQSIKLLMIMPDHFEMAIELMNKSCFAEHYFFKAGNAIQKLT